MKNFISKIIDIIKPIIICAVLLGIFLIFYRPAVVDGVSMYPTLQHNDILLLKRNIKNLKRGDIIAVNSNSLKVALCKRVIGIEGDTLEINKEGLFINGELQKEDYINEQDWLKNTTEINITIPKDCVFVMGDNRNNSSDSRSLGCISKIQILGIMTSDLTKVSHIDLIQYKIILYILWLALILYYIYINIISYHKNHKDNNKISSNIDKGGT